MPDTHVAESILVLVTSRERAASTVGDLLEGAQGRSDFRFWASVLRTAASLLWLGVAESPGRVLCLALIGLGIDIASDLLFAFFSGVAFFAAAMRSGHAAQLDFIGWKIWFVAPALLTSLLIGRWLVRWAHGRALAVCLAYLALVPVCNLVWMMLLPGDASVSALAWGFAGDAALRTPVLLGAWWGRHAQKVLQKGVSLN